jgi:hypothetical protein
MATTWNQAFEDSPADSDDPSDGALRIRELKEAVQERIVKEHEFTLTDSFADQAWHKEGSAKGYYKSAEPSNRPDGSTSLDSTDAGRLWVDSDDGRLYVYTGSAWDALTPGTTQSDEINSLTAAEIQQLANIGSETISASNWGHVAAMDQDVSTTDDVTFNSVTGTVAASNVTEISNLTAAEGAQLENINSVTITNTQWGYLGALDQDLATSDDVTFAQLTVDSYRVDSKFFHKSNPTANEIFDALKNEIPNTGDDMAIFGAFTGQVTPSTDGLVAVSRAERTGSSEITLYGASIDDNQALALKAVSVTDGGGTNNRYTKMSIAW